MLPPLLPFVMSQVGNALFPVPEIPSPVRVIPFPRLNQQLQVLGLCDALWSGPLLCGRLGTVVSPVLLIDSGLEI